LKVTEELSDLAPGAAQRRAVAAILALVVAAPEDLAELGFASLDGDEPDTATAC